MEEEIFECKNKKIFPQKTSKDRIKIYVTAILNIFTLKLFSFPIVLFPKENKEVSCRKLMRTCCL